MRNPFSRLWNRTTLSYFEKTSSSDAQLESGHLFTSTGHRLDWVYQDGTLLYLGGDSPLPPGTKFFQDVEQEIHNQLKRARSVAPAGKVVGDTKHLIQDLVLSTDTMTTMPYYVSEWSSENTWTPGSIEANIQLQKSRGSERNSVVFLEGSNEYCSMFLGIPGVDLTVLVGDDDQLTQLGIRSRTSRDEEPLQQLAQARRDRSRFGQDQSSEECEFCQGQPLVGGVACPVCGRNDADPYRPSESSNSYSSSPDHPPRPDTYPGRSFGAAELQYEGEGEDSSEVVQAEPQTEGYQETISPTPQEPSDSGPAVEPSGDPVVDVPATQAIEPAVNINTQPGSMDYDGSPDLT